MRRPCVCGHTRHAHRHYVHTGDTRCALCYCQRWRPRRWWRRSRTPVPGQRFPRAVPPSPVRPAPAPAYEVLCARCDQPWPENDDGVRYAYGDWWCRDETACEDRMIAQEDSHYGF